MTDSERLVDDAQALADLVDAIAEAPLVALDTEFVREQTYYPRLCLIQVATPDRLACVDCVAGLDLKPLFSALLAPGRTWLLHSVRQDLEAMQRFMFRLPSRLIDSQIASAPAGQGTPDWFAGSRRGGIERPPGQGIHSHQLGPSALARRGAAVRTRRCPPPVCAVGAYCEES